MKKNMQEIIDRLCQTLGVDNSDACEEAGLPCIEERDAEKLCKCPLVSVRLITYNHEHWIAQAIESVVSQKTSFPFELIIAEDCSTDATRAICLSYQKKYPHIIRVIYSDSNVGLRFNSIRADQQVRGQYVALLEGDDYWIDDFKLQKQYELLLRYPDAMICMACTRVSNPSGKFGIKDGAVLCPDEASGQTLKFTDFTRFYLHTSTYFFSPKGFKHIKDLAKKYYLYDSIIYFSLSSLSVVPYLKEVVSVYRITDQGLYTGAVLTTRAKQEIYVSLALLLCLDGHRNYLCKKFSANMSYYLNHLRITGTGVKKQWQCLCLSVKLIHALKNVTFGRRVLSESILTRSFIRQFLLASFFRRA
jgi:glycosyltransferase involved in cell wall biosynthesis